MRSAIAHRVGNATLMLVAFAVGLTAGLIVMPAVVRGGAAVAGTGHSACAVQRITAGYVTDYSANAGGYAVAVVTLDSVPTGCIGQRVTVTLRSASGGVVAARTGVVTGPGQRIALPRPVPADAVADVQVAAAT